jgi:hypothetical protein
MVCVAFSLIGCDPKVSLLLAGIDISLAEDRKEGVLRGMGGLKMIL